MRYYLSPNAVLKWIEIPSLYNMQTDELYELDEDSFHYLHECAGDSGCTSKEGAFTDYCVDEGLLTTKPASLKRPPLHRASCPSLRYLELQITDACNLQCNHCYLEDTTGSELAPSQVKKILSDFEEMQGLRVMITGGEPLMHSRFSELNEMLPDLFIRKVLFSNGLLLTREVLGSLNVDEIQISIDGLEQAHELLRGSGTYKISMDAVQRSRDAGFDVSIATMVHRSNLADFDNMERLFKGMGIKSWSVDIPCNTGRLRGHASLLVDPDEGGKYLGYGYGEGLHTSGAGYGCGLHLLSVMADGKIAKCSFYRNEPVDTIENGIRNAWNKLSPVRLSTLNCKCEYLEICRGGCRFRGELLEGREGRDLYRCVLYGII